ncbi:hypothetical protein [Legionella sp. CNM-4043-24]|uniref:hypothetical protein n=1 Tax=Legionella sp. CNM-4043-24 TaxID=3421646 RepID=UPI00403B2904
MITKDKIRQKLLETVKNEIERNKRSRISSNLQSGVILQEVAKQFEITHNPTYEQMILSEFQCLMNTGYLAWGYDLANPNPPFFHITDQGIKSLENLNRDPCNPSEYLRYIDSQCQLDDTERSYLNEAISTFNAGHHKSAAVMIGATAECLILKLRNAMNQKHSKPPKGLSDWKAKTIFNTLKTVLDKHVSIMSSDLRDEYNAYWPAFNEQIRRTRNDAGHPENISSFKFEDVHASLLMFPNVAKLTTHLLAFISNNQFS